MKFISAGSLSLPPGFPRHNSVSNLKDGFKGLDPKLFFGGGGVSGSPDNSKGERGVDPVGAGADHATGSDDEYVEEDEDDLTGGPGQDPSAKGKIRKKKTRTVFSRSQVINNHHYIYNPYLYYYRYLLLDLV